MSSVKCRPFCLDLSVLREINGNLPVWYKGISSVVLRFLKIHQTTKKSKGFAQESNLIIDSFHTVNVSWSDLMFP